MPFMSSRTRIQSVRSAFMRVAGLADSNVAGLWEIRQCSRPSNEERAMRIL